MGHDTFQEDHSSPIQNEPTKDLRGRSRDLIKIARVIRFRIFSRNRAGDEEKKTAQKIAILAHLVQLMLRPDTRVLDYMEYMFTNPNNCPTTTVMKFVKHREQLG